MCVYFLQTAPCGTTVGCSVGRGLLCVGPWALQDRGVSTLLDGKGTSTRRHPARPKTALVGARWAIPCAPGPACPPQVWRTGLTLGFLPRSPVPAWVTTPPHLPGHVLSPLPVPPLPELPLSLSDRTAAFPGGVQRRGRPHPYESRRQLEPGPASCVVKELSAFFGSCWFTGELPLSQARCPPGSRVAFPYGPRVLGALLLCLAESTGRRTVFQGW